ncbi:hypothetical protein DL770_008940 [Monosporascus sp. CRB-9-2]|nr:hypothetical protein DL770_008940 [Monosporascus sp. CRB-9-2]
MAETFDLPDFPSRVTVSVSPGVLEELREWNKNIDLPEFSKLFLEFPAFGTWLETLEKELPYQEEVGHPFHDKPYSLKSIRILSVKWWGPMRRPQGFVMMEANISNDDKPPKKLPGVVFLRGGSVAVLMVLTPKDDPEERWVIMTTQPRIPAGTLAFWEIPAGMLDDEAKQVTLKAQKEIHEETGLTVPYHELKDMTKMALESATVNQNLQPAMYPSPGGADEYIHLLVWEKQMSRMNVMDLREKLTGLRAQGEMITLKLVPYQDLWKEGARDSKTLAAWALYEGLKREGRL